jgi:hypothetical protein
MSQPQSRRQFVKIALGVGSLALFAPKVFSAEERRKAKPATGGGAASGPAGAAGGGDATAPLVVPGSPGLASSVHYVHKNSEVKDAALKVERGGTPFAQQTCSKCMLFTPAGKKGGEDVGNCSLFAGQVVKATGWCASWSKKA